MKTAPQYKYSPGEQLDPATYLANLPASVLAVIPKPTPKSVEFEISELTRWIEQIRTACAKDAAWYEFSWGPNSRWEEGDYGNPHNHAMATKAMVDRMRKAAERIAAYEARLAALRGLA